MRSQSKQKPYPQPVHSHDSSRDHCNDLSFANVNFKIVRRRLPTPILLSSICSDWRRTVVGTPQLWSSIMIDLPSLSQRSDFASSRLLGLATLIDEWLARSESGQLPLYISLCSGRETPPDPSGLTLGRYRPIFKIFNQYSFRWHSLNISSPPTLLSFLQPDCLPLLEQLHIASESDWRNPDHVITFPSTPCLNTVEIQPFMNSTFSPFSNIGIQWDTVTHVSAELITTAQLPCASAPDPTTGSLYISQDDCRRT